MPDRISREVVIDAPPDLVWAIVTDPRHVARWFSDEAEIDLRPGGAMLLTWHGHGDLPMPGSRRSTRPTGSPSAGCAGRTTNPATGTSTLVEFALAAEGSGTRLRVVESGFQRLAWAEEDKARYADENADGWVHELDELCDYAAGLGSSPDSS